LFIYILYRPDNCDDEAGGDDVYYNSFIDGCSSPLNLKENTIWNIQALSAMSSMWRI